MKAQLLVLLLIATGCACPCKKSDVVNPYEYTINDDGFVPNKGINRFTADLTAPGSQDLFVGTGDGGNAGETFLVFLKADKGYRKAGKVFLHTQAFQILESKHNDVHDLLAYHRSGNSRGNLVQFEFDGKEFVKKSETKIKSRDLNKHLKPTKVNIIHSKAGEVW